MSNPYYGNDAYNQGGHLKKKKRSPLDLGFNWFVIISLSVFAFTLIAAHLDQYRDERWFHTMVKDGITPDDVDKIYEKDGLVRNMQFKDLSKTEFAMHFWRLKVPRFLILIFLPLGIAQMRALRRKPSRSMDMTFYVATGIAFLHLIFSVGNINHWW
jgi:hypothetical protein